MTSSAENTGYSPENAAQDAVSASGGNCAAHLRPSPGGVGSRLFGMAGHLRGSGRALPGLGCREPTCARERDDGELDETPPRSP